MTPLCPRRQGCISAAGPGSEWMNELQDCWGSVGGEPSADAYFLPAMRGACRGHGSLHAAEHGRSGRSCRAGLRRRSPLPDAVGHAAGGGAGPAAGARACNGRAVPGLAMVGWSTPESMTTAAAPAELPATAVYALGRDPAEVRGCSGSQANSAPPAARCSTGPASGARPGHDRSRLRAEWDHRAARGTGFPGRARGGPGGGPGPRRHGPGARASARAGQRRDRGGRRPAYRAAVRLVRPGARAYPAGHRSPAGGGSRRDGPAGPPGWVGRQPGARRRVLVVLPRSSGLGPAVRNLPRLFQPQRRRSAHRPPADRAVPRGGIGGYRGGGTGGRLPGHGFPPHGPG